MISFWRQMSMISPDDLADLKVLLIGTGGIGSFTAFALSKIGLPALEVFDPDTVEGHNIPCQLFRPADIGKKKVEAIAEICENFSEIKIAQNPRRFDAKNVSGVVLSGVDSIDSRREIWEKIRYNFNVPLYIDGRMGAEVIYVYSIRPCDPDDISWYERTLYSKGKIVEEPCTARAIIYTAFLMAGLMANQVKKFAKGSEMPREIIFDVFNLTLVTR